MMKPSLVGKFRKGMAGKTLSQNFELNFDKGRHKRLSNRSVRLIYQLAQFINF